MKFSEMTSNQPSGGGVARISAKCWRRRPTPCPSSGLCMARLRVYFFFSSFFSSAAAITLPPLSLHSLRVVFVQPWPLQAFLPAQPWSAPPQAPVPLHELTPPHFT